MSEDTAYSGKAPSNLGELVAPLIEEEFLTLLRERKLTFLRGTNGPRYAALLSWKVLQRVIQLGEFPLTEFRVTKGSAYLPELFYTKNGKVDCKRLDTLLTNGYSIIFTRIEPYVPALIALCENIKSRLHEKIEAGVIVTGTGTGGALELHYDPEDLVILQLEGTKRWQIYGPAVSNPVEGMPKTVLPGNAIIFDEVLQPGDFLLLPGGNWHHCENGSGRSIHLGIFFIPPTGWHALKAFSSQMLSEQKFRAPITRLADASELTRLEADLKNRLIEKIGQLSLNEFLNEWTQPQR